MTTSTQLLQEKPAVQHNWLLLAPVLLYTFLVLLSVNNSFFWDTTVQGAQHGTWFYDTNFRELYLPEQLDVGYQPTFGFLLALVWKLFGRTLVVSHLFMLPFLLGLVWQLYLLTKRYLPPATAMAGLLLLSLDPTLLAQATLVSSDVLMVFLYLLSLNLILRRQRLVIAAVLLLLGMLHLRGTVAVAALFFTDLLLQALSSRRFRLADSIRLGLPYVPATVAVLFWFYGHYLHTGWLLQSNNPDWPYHSGRAVADVPFMLRNIVIVGWRLTDFGRIVVWLVAFATVYLLVWKLGKRKTIASRPAALQLLVFWLVPLLIYSLSFVGYTNSIGHRYLLVIILLFMLFTLYLVAQLPWARVRLAFRAAMAVALVAGHFVVSLYPEHIAKGWDATLAYLPYDRLKKEAIAFLRQEQLPLETVGTRFPALHPLALTDLQGSGRFTEADLTENRYIFYTNISNDFSNEELVALQDRQQWVPVFSRQSGAVTVVVYERVTPP